MKFKKNKFLKSSKTVHNGYNKVPHGCPNCDGHFFTLCHINPHQNKSQRKLLRQIKYLVK